MKASLGLASFGFITVVLFIVLSQPFEDIIDAVDDQGEEFGVDSYIHEYLNNLKTIFGLVFVFSLVGLIVWFILGAGREEYEQY